MRVSTSYRAFYQPRLAAGVGMRVGTFIWSSAITVGVLGDQFFVWAIALGVGALLHSMLAWAFKGDHRLFEIYANYVLTHDCYDVGGSKNSAGFSIRPRGYGKGLPC